MISFKDAFVLARTKLKTRKVRTGLTVGISGILFGLLAAISLFVAGIESSVKSFSENGFGSRYFVQAMYIQQPMSYYDVSEKQEVIKRAEEIHAQNVKEKQAEAKRLSLEYNAESEPSVTTKEDGRLTLNVDNAASSQAIQEYINAHASKTPVLSVIKDRLKEYNPKSYYSAARVYPSDGSWATMKDGKESFKEKINTETNYNPYDKNIDPISMGVTVMDTELTTPFLLKKDSWRPSNQTVPVVVTYAQAEKILGLKKLASNATTKQKLDRIQTIREQIAGKTVSTCYRNSSSIQAIQETTMQQKEIQKNATNKEYIKPKKITSLPEATTCGGVVVVSDTRTAAEKKYDANQQLFDEKFKISKPVEQQKYVFEVVGLSPGFDESSYSTLSGMVASLFSSTLGNSWVVPRGMYDQLPEAAKLSKVTSDPSDQYASVIEAEDTYAEFANFEDALAAVKSTSCSFGDCSFAQDLYIMPFGGGSITLAQLKQEFLNIAKYVIAVIVAIAAVIMLGTIGRAIADSRKETAVFRAIGAKRKDISAIYFMYSLLLSFRTIIFAGIVSLVIVLAVDFYNYQDATVNAQLLFGASDLSKTFHLFGVNAVELGSLAGIVVVTGVISAIPPLIRAVRRNPINDMRDDN